MKRKGMALAAAVTLCSMLTTGCAGAAQTPAETAVLSETVENTETSGDGGVVSLTVWAEEINHAVLGKMIDSFKQEYAGQAEFDIQIAVSSDAQTKSDVLGDIHNAADIFFIADDQLSSLAAGGALAKVPNADEVRAANTEGSVAAASIGDTLFAYPMSADNGYFLYYDKTYFTDEDVKTLDRILEVAAENEKKFSMEWDSGWYLYSFFGNTGLEFGINDDGVTNHCNWNTTEGDIIGADIVTAMLDIAANPGFINLPDGEFMAGVQDGSIIAGVSGVWNAMEIQEAWGSDYGAVKLPTYTCAGKQIQMSSFVGYKMVGANAYSEHVDWALKFADWITNEQNQVLRFEERNQGPSNIKAAASDEVGKVPAIQAVMAQSEYGVLQRVGNNYWDPFTAFGEDLAAGNPSGKEPQEIIDTLVAGITASTVN
ncbi:MAG: extracellular solute-binding protein [Lachnospiraceae bacterium]|nr:extracellular solute-binding protein [Lachnospiraceae bacterium]